MTPPPFFLEDLVPGAIFRTGTLTVDTAAITAFAAQFDPQPFHLDPVAAKTSLFGGLVASGWHTAALTMRLLVTSELQLAGGLVGLGITDLRWPRAVFPGDTLSAVIEVLTVQFSASRPERGTVKLRTTTINQGGEPVLMMTSVQLVPRRTSGQPEENPEAHD
ncbi:MAG: MaoC family dehydratase [Chloroflexaceae bacterium]|nr:MaoC family dehydratase [Chloroflexaceae bacterium]